MSSLSLLYTQVVIQLILATLLSLESGPLLRDMTSPARLKPLGLDAKSSNQEIWSPGPLRPKASVDLRNTALHQNEIICPEDWAFLVSDGIPLEAAAVITVVARTASDGLTFCLDFERSEDPAYFTSKNRRGYSIDPMKSLLIWGAGTSCGFCAVQIARLCGAYPIIVTSSPQHHTRLLELGATHCFDYRSPTVINDIRNLGVELCGAEGIQNAFDCIGLAGKERNEHLAAIAASACGANAKIVTVIPIPGSTFLEAWASPEKPAVFKPSYLGGERTIYTPVDEERAALSKKTLEWIVKHYGEGIFVIPNIKIIKGGVENAKAAILDVAELGAGLTKVAILHPF